MYHIINVFILLYIHVFIYIYFKFIFFVENFTDVSLFISIDSLHPAPALPPRLSYILMFLVVIYCYWLSQVKNILLNFSNCLYIVVSNATYSFLYKTENYFFILFLDHTLPSKIVSIPIYASIFTCITSKS